MKPSRYQWKMNGASDMGFIAQELQMVIPFAVAGNPDSDPNVNPMGVDYGRVTPVLTAAIQELLEEVKMLKKRVSELENEN